MHWEDASKRSYHALGFVLIKDEGNFCQKKKTFIILRLCSEDKDPDVSNAGEFGRGQVKY